MANQIRYQVNLDVNQNSLNQLKSSLQSLQKMKLSDIMKINNTDISTATAIFNNIKTQAMNVESALKSAFNTKLNTYNIEAFNTSLRQSGSSIEQVYQSFRRAGTSGQAAFRNLSTQVLSTNIQLKQSHAWLDKMASTLANTIKWNAASAAIRGVTSSIQQAWGFTKSLDTSLNNIRIVTGKSADEMGKFAVQANKVAKELGKTTTDYTNASLIYAQQGLSDKEIQERARITLKTASVTGQSTEAVSQQLTAVWNGYKVSADEAELYVDRLAAVAAKSASNLAELSTGMSKVASAAATMGVGEQQLAAQLSTIISVTRQAPESVGTALRTIYARISDIKAGIDEDGVSLGNYSGKLADLGFNVLDANNNLRDMGEVIEEIGGRWGDLTRQQQISLTQTMAGQRQYNNLLALFDNFEKYNEMLDVAANAQGTLQQQQDTYIESINAHLNTLKGSIESIYMSLGDTGFINQLIDGLSSVANFTSTAVQGWGGGIEVLKTLGVVGFSVFSDQIAKSINTTITNMEIAKNNAQQFSDTLEATKAWQGIPNLDQVTKDLLSNRQSLLELSKVMTKEQFSGMQGLLNDITKLGNELAPLEQKVQSFQKAIDSVSNKSYKQTLGNESLQKEISVGIQKQIQEYQNLAEEIEKVQNQTMQFGLSQKNLDLGIVYENTKAGIDDLIGKIKELNEQGRFDGHKQALQQLFQQYESLPSHLNTDQAREKFNTFFNGLKQLALSSGVDLQNTFQNLSQAWGDDKFNQDLEQKRQAFQNLVNEFVNGQQRMAKAAQISTYVKLASSLSSVAMGIQQINRLPGIWKNQDLTTGEKILQTVTTLGMALPMLVNGISGVNTALGLVMTMTTEQAALTTAATVANSAHAISFGAVTTEAGKAALAVKIFNHTLLINPLTAFVAAILAVGTAFAVFKSRAEEASKAAKEESEKIIQQQNDIQEATAQTHEFISEVEKLNSQYQQGITSRLQLQTSITNLSAEYDKEGQRLDELVEKYGDLTTALVAYRKENAEAQRDSLTAEIGAKQKLLNEHIKDADVEGWGKPKNGKYGLRFDEMFGSSQGNKTREYTDILYQQLQSRGLAGEVAINGYSLNEIGLGQDQQSFQDILFGNGSLNQLTAHLEIPDEKSFVEYYEAINGIVTGIKDYVSFPGMTTYLDANGLKDFESYNRMTEWLDAFSREYTEIKQLQDQLTACNAEVDVLDKQLEQLRNKEQNIGDKASGEGTSESSKSKGAHFSFFGVQSAKDYQERIIGLRQQLSQLGYDDSETLANTLVKRDYRDVYDQYAKYGKYVEQLRNKFKEENADLENAIFNLDDEHFNALFNFDQSRLKNWNDLSNLLQYISSLDFSNVKELQEAAPMQEKTGQDMKAEAAQQYVFYQSVEDQVRGGKSISKKQRDSLDPQLQEMFTMMANGTYKMTADAEKFYSTVQNLKLDGFYNAISSIEQEIDRLQNLSDERLSYQDLSKSQAGSPDANWRSNVGQQLDYLSEYNDASMTGISEEQIGDWQKALEANLNFKPDQLEWIAQAIQAIGDRSEETAGKVEELKAAAESIDQQIFDAMFPTDQDVDLDALASLTDAIQDVADSADDLVGKQLADELTQDRRAAEDVAEAILRFDDAIQDVIDGYDDWINALNNGSLQDQAEIMDDLRDAYADLLDIDGSSLSDDFLTNTQNLDLMKDAINGDIDAYNQLAQAAATDILMTLGLNDEQALTHFQNDLAWIQSFDSAVFGNIADLAVGAELNDDAFLQGLTDMVNAAGMTAQQATDYLSSMGVDAEVIENTTEDTQENDITGYTGEAVPVTGVVNFPTVSASTTENGVVIEQGTPISETWEYDALKVNPDTAQILSKKQNKSFGLKVTSAHKSSGGGFKFSQAKNGGGSSGTARRNPSGSGKGGGSKPKKGSGGKGGGSGKEVKPDKTQKDKKQKLEDERDLYHDINIELSKINTTLNRIEKIQDRLYGKKLIDNLNKQKEILKQHIETLQAKQKIQKEDLAQQKKTLENLGVTFDSYGNISNYMDILEKKQEQMNKQIDEYNALIEKYNASTDKEAKDQMKDQIDVLSKQIDKSQKAYDKLKDQIGDYDKLREDMEKLVDDIDEDIQRQIEINITKFRMEVEIRLDMGQAQRDWNKFRRQVLEHTDIIKDSDFSKIYKDAQLNYNDAVSYFDINGHKGTIQTLTQQLKETRGQIEKIDKTGYSAIYGDNKKEAMDHLKSDLQELMKQIEDYEKLFDEVDQAYLDTIENSKDQMDKQVDDYEYITELYQHDMDLLTLLYGDKNYDAMDKYYSSVHQNQLKELDFLKKESEFWKEKWDAAAMAGDTKAAEQFEKHYRDSIKNLNSVIEESAKTLQDKYANAIDKIFDELDKKISGGMGTDYLSMEWELMNKNADQYLDTINAAFAIQDIQRKYQNAINDTKSIKSQRTLKQLMDQQVNKLQEKDRLSQYDVDRAEKLLQLQRARIALEDAQSAKTSMRLKRDAQGNYSYQYVADDTEIQDAQQNLLDLQQDLYNFDKEAYKKNLNDMLSAWKDFQARYKEIVLDTSLTEEQKTEQLALLRQKYGKYINDKTQENYTIRLNFTDSFYDSMDLLYKQNLDNYQWMTGEEKKSLKDNLDANKEKYKTVIGDQLKLFQEYRKEYDRILSSDLTEEEKVAALEKLTREYEQNLTKLKGQEIQARQDLEEAGFRISAGFYTDNYEDYKNMLDYQAEKLTSDFLPTWNGGIQQMTESVAGQGGFIPTCDQAFEDIDQTTSDYERELDTLALTAGIDLGQIKSGVDEIAQAFEKLTPDNDQFLERIKQDLAAMEQLRQEMQRLKEENQQALNQAIAAAEQTHMYVQEQQGKAADAAHEEKEQMLVEPTWTVQEEPKVFDPAATVPKETKKEKKEKKKKENTQSLETLAEGIAGSIHYWTDAGWDDWPDRETNLINKFGEEKGKKLYKEVQKVINPIYAGKKDFEHDGQYYRKYLMSQFKTGGYTGDWASEEGRLGILHQKELVLNKEDTKNLLSTVNIMRTIMSSIGGTIANKLGDLRSGVINATNDSNNAVEQSVHIEASFPNVNSKREIQEAFNELVNLAAQRAMKR